MIVKMTGMAPPGLFIDEVIRVGRDELIVECNYLLEAKNQDKFRTLLENDNDLSNAKFKVPAVIHELTTQQVITTEYCPGGTIDKVAFLDQEERNRIGRNIMKLTMKELFIWRFMQTDPNWGNFLYDVGTGTTYLIDFGSAREYSKLFVDGYLRIVWASANQDTKTLMDQSHKMGFLTGEENDIMLNAHKMSGFTVGEPFATNDTYDFAHSGITGRISEHGSHFLQHRLTPPPEEVYTLHRKLAGAYNLCIRLGANIECRDLLEEIVKNHVFDDGQDHPMQ
jgi:aarF domain-containing kinase